MQTAAERRVDREIVRLMSQVDGSMEDKIAATLRMPLKVVRKYMEEIAAADARRDLAKMPKVVKPVKKKPRKRVRVPVAERKRTHAKRKREVRAETKRIVVEQALVLRAKGVSYKKIADEVGYVTHSTIQRWLREEGVSNG